MFYFYNIYRSDILIYDGLDQIIIGACLTTPKKGIFVEEVEYLLVLSTPIEIFILAITLDKDELTIHPTKYSVSSNNVSMHAIISTGNGRIFLGGNDGNLYELIYKAEDSYFSKKCTIVNISSSKWNQIIPKFLKWSGNDPIVTMTLDDERNFLYTVNESSVINVYYLGIDGNETKKLTTYSNLIKDSYELASRGLGNIDAQSALNVYALFPIKVSESDYIQLVCVTKSGIRIYIRCNTTGLYGFNLEVVHVRLFSNISPDKTNLSVNAAFYNQGVLFLGIVDRNDVNSSNAIAVSPNYQFNLFDELPGNTSFIETISQFNCNGDFSSFLEIELNRTANNPTSLLTYQYSRNEMADQFLLPPRFFMGMTSSGLHKFTKIRPIDILRDYICKSKGSDSKEIKTFFNEYGYDNSCAMCLHLACYDDLASTFGSPIKISSSYRDSDIASWAKRIYFSYGSTKVQNDQNPSDFSSAHEGLVIYLARLLRFIWNENFVLFDNDTYQPSISLEQIGFLKKVLGRLNKFLTENPSLYETKEYANNKNKRQKTKSSNSQKLKEKNSVMNHWKVLNRTVEALSLIEIFAESKPSHESTPTFVPSERIKSMTFRDVISLKESEVIEDFIKWIVLLHHDEANIDTITNKLRAQCPSYFSEVDRKRALANESLNKASSAQTVADKTKYLKESLQLYKEIATGLNTQDLSFICSEYMNLYYYTGIIELSLHCASVNDKNNLALAWLKSGKDERMEKHKKIYRFREECYQEIRRVLDTLTSPKLDNEIDKAKLKDTILKDLLNIDDELLHYNLYYWFINNNRKSELINLKTDYIETFLKLYCPMKDRNSLLWRYYLKNDKFGKAAKILISMAESNDDVKLEDRIEYLTKALNFSQRKHASSESIKELKDKVDIARIQLSVKTDIVNDDTLVEDRKKQLIDQLNSKLYSAYELYEQYCKPYKLYESTLSLFISTEYSPELEGLIFDVWEKIINKTVDSLDDSIEPLQKKIEKLLQKYPSYDYLYPLERIIIYLEVISLRLKDKEGWSEEWVADTLMTKVPYFMLFPMYYNLYNRHAKYKIDKMHLFVVVVYILEKWERDETEDDEFGTQYVDSAIGNLISESSTFTDEKRKKKLKEKLDNLKSKIIKRVK